MSKRMDTVTTMTQATRIKSTPAAIWPLLCPVREYDWIKDWQCELVHSASGFNELGCVFRTDFPTEGEPETWITSAFQPNERLEFVRANALRIIRYVITLTFEGYTTRIDWTQHVTPLCEAGVEYLERRKEVFPEAMQSLGRELNHFLTTGEMLRA